MILSENLIVFQRAVGWCETVNTVFAVSYRSRIPERFRVGISMEFRVIPLQIRGLTEPHEAAVFSNREHCNTGGTVVNIFVDHPAKIFRVFAGFFLFRKLTAKNSYKQALTAPKKTSRKELQL